MTRLAPRGDTVAAAFEFCLIGMLGSGYFAILGSGYLDSATAIATAGGLLLRLLMIFGAVRWRPSPKLTQTAALGYAAFFPLDYGFLSPDFLTATVHMVFFLAIAKLLTAESRRDYLYLQTLAFGEMLAAALLSSSLGFVVFLALFLISTSGALSCSEILRQRSRSGQVTAAGGPRFGVPLGGLVVALAFGTMILGGALFFVLPRTARAAFESFAPRQHVTGFSNEMLLGEIGEIQRSVRTMMHVRVFSREQPRNLRWRGAILTQFDGRRWYNPVQSADILRPGRALIQLVNDAHRLRPGRRISYEVHLKSFHDTLFFAGVPEFLEINQPLVVRSSNGTFRLGYTPDVPVVYGAYALLDDGASAALSATGQELQQELLLPPIDPRILPLVRQWTQGGGTAAESARRIESELRRRFGYTLDLPSTPSADPISHFLFERRRGHCEYFASSMAVMLRAISIPSRIVTGFQAGNYNPVSGWHVIRGADAHSWVEAYLPGQGWTAFDPTPASPQGNGQTLTERAALYIDALEMFWQDWVLNYSLEQQLGLAVRAGQGRAWPSFASIAAEAQRKGRQLGPGLVAGAAALWLLFRYAPRLRLPARRPKEGAARQAASLYDRLLEHLRRRGIEKPDSMTATEFAATIRQPELAALVAAFAAHYHAARFGQVEEAAREMAAVLGAIERPNG
ncbi:MAG: DUF3488 domain-containing protein [Acidobacteria bacterium]|nr:DUF3488 domain-containing protein [Acidobacteriota bacterium]